MYLTILAEDDSATNITADAMLTLGTLYHTGRFKIGQDYPKARQWYEKVTRINQKSIVPIYESTSATHWALTNLGYHHYYGLDIEVDYEKAFYYFAKATFYYNYNAMYKLGDMYYYGLFVNQNYETAYYWYNEAENHANNMEYGYPNIMYRLGLCNLYGHGTEKDLIAALSYLQRAELQFYRLIESGNDDFAHKTLPKRLKLKIVNSLKGSKRIRCYKKAVKSRYVDILKAENNHMRRVADYRECSPRDQRTLRQMFSASDLFSDLSITYKRALHKAL